MADSIEQKIIDAMLVRMATILTGNGFETDIGTTVFDNRPNIDQGEDLPAINLVQGTTRTVEINDNRRQSIRLMPVLIEAMFNRADAAEIDAAYARKAIKDIYKAIRSDGTAQDGFLAERWPAVEGTKPGLAMDTREKNHAIVRAETSYEITGVQVEIEVQYLSGKFNLED